MNGRRRRRGGAELVIISWRDIPAQVTASSADGKQTQVLDHRFQEAIDRAAAVAGLTDTDSYVAEWRRDTRPLQDDPADAVATLVAELHRLYDDDRLRGLIRSGGLDSGA